MRRPRLRGVRRHQVPDGARALRARHPVGELRQGRGRARLRSCLSCSPSWAWPTSWRAGVRRPSRLGAPCGHTSPTFFSLALMANGLTDLSRRAGAAATAPLSASASPLRPLLLHGVSLQFEVLMAAVGAPDSPVPWAWSSPRGCGCAHRTALCRCALGRRRGWPSAPGSGVRGKPPPLILDRTSWDAGRGRDPSGRDSPGYTPFPWPTSLPPSCTTCSG